MARRKYRSGWSFFTSWWTRVVPKGTRGARKGLIHNGAGKGFTEIWLRPKRVRAGTVAWRMKSRRRKY